MMLIALCSVCEGFYSDNYAGECWSAVDEREDCVVGVVENLVGNAGAVFRTSERYSVPSVLIYSFFVSADNETFIIVDRLNFQVWRHWNFSQSMSRGKGIVVIIDKI